MTVADCESTPAVSTLLVVGRDGGGSADNGAEVTSQQHVRSRTHVALARLCVCVTCREVIKQVLTCTQLKHSKGVCQVNHI
jgi:hypothetical protein